jgi:hypothetical protein
MADPMLGAGEPGLIDMIDAPHNAGGWAANNAAAGTGPLGLDPMFAGPGGSYNEAEYLNNVRLQNNFNEGIRQQTLAGHPPIARFGTWARNTPQEWNQEAGAITRALPENAQYFDASGQPRADDPRKVAADAGISVQQLAGGLMPRYGSTYGAVGQGYDYPSDKGGFFRVSDLYQNYASGVPRAATFGQGGLSTNNWRLLGMGPGWIMRNGALIDVTSGGAMWGGPRSWVPNGGFSGEQFMTPTAIGLGTGTLFGVPNLYTGSNPGQAGWPGADMWRDIGKNPE